MRGSTYATYTRREAFHSKGSKKKSFVELVREIIAFKIKISKSSQSEKSQFYATTNGIFLEQELIQVWHYRYCLKLVLFQEITLTRCLISISFRISSLSACQRRTSKRESIQLLSYSGKKKEDFHRFIQKKRLDS